jgi:hypothetical protein
MATVVVPVLWRDTGLVCWWVAMSQYGHGAITICGRRLDRPGEDKASVGYQPKGTPITCILCARVTTSDR